MGHHIDAEGRFQSDKYPDLPPDRIVLSFRSPAAWQALAALAEGYGERDPELAADIMARLASLGADLTPKPVDSLVICPKCHSFHVDEPEPEVGWTNPPHRSHKCANCMTVWRQADVPTNGVAPESLETKGKDDTWP